MKEVTNTVEKYLFRAAPDSLLDLQPRQGDLDLYSPGDLRDPGHRIGMTPSPKPEFLRAWYAHPSQFQRGDNGVATSSNRPSSGAGTNHNLRLVNILRRWSHRSN